MRSFFLIALSVVTLSGCATIRDKNVYATEIQFSDLTVQRQAPFVRDFISASCTCSESAWTASAAGVTDASCASAADWYAVYAARWAWHMEMMRYNGGLIEGDPGAAPEIPQGCELPDMDDRAPAPEAPSVPTDPTAGGEA